MSLNKNHPVPLYFQLAEHIRQQIQAGEYLPGDQIPSERELSEQAGISRMTVRQAVSYLAQEGTLEVKAGIGTFVARPKLVHDSINTLGFSEEMMRQGAEVTSRVLEQVEVIPPPHIAAFLAMAPQDTAVKIVRLRLGDGLPLLLETSYLPAALCPELAEQDLRDGSLYQLLEDVYDLTPKCSRQTVEAAIANEYEADLFDLDPDASMAMILLEGITYSEDDQPFEHFRALYRGDRIKIQLVSQGCQSPAGELETEPAARRVTLLME
jgi:GntR family transcriptional regulator